MEAWPEKAVLDFMSNAEPGSIAHTRASAELQRRATEIDRNSLKAQQKSADAAAEAAKSARASARYALLAAVIAALSLAASLFAILRK
jgi:hypothetical protein